jgi:hypothetical protein
MAQNPYLVYFTITQPTGSVPTGTLHLVVNQGDAIGPMLVDIPGLTTGNVLMLAGDKPGDYTYTRTGIAAADYQAIVRDGALSQGAIPFPSFTVDFTVKPAPDTVLGCTAPNAFNFDPAANTDSDPTSCVFVVVDVAPAQLAAAHLPIPVLLRAAPTTSGLASIVVLVLETADALAGPWREFGRLKTICDDDARAEFNLSEAAKSLLRIQPPVESGVDPALSALLRARYEVLDPDTLAVRYTGEVGTTRVLNAVVQATSGATLTSATTYATVPNGGQLWQSVVTYAGGVRATPLNKDSDGCRAREFVWLNAVGAWDQGFFFGRHVHGTDQADAITYRNTTEERYSSRGIVRDTLAVYSDITDWATYQLIRGLRRSIQVYERVGANQYVPVLMVAENFPEYVEQTDKTFQVNFTVSYPAQLIQTQ